MYSFLSYQFKLLTSMTIYRSIYGIFTDITSRLLKCFITLVIYSLSLSSTNLRHGEIPQKKSIDIAIEPRWNAGALLRDDPSAQPTPDLRSVQVHGWLTRLQQQANTTPMPTARNMQLRRCIFEPLSSWCPSYFTSL